MKLYHGSESIIERPRWGGGNPRNDYGRGFYCTEDVALAMEWACGDGRDGFANAYEIDLSGLRVLRLNGDGYHILHWLALLTRHRTYWEHGAISAQAKEYLQTHFLPDISEADVMIGYRADDSYFSFARDFVANAISLQQLSEAMRLGRLGEQVVLKSRQAFAALRFVGYTYAPAEIWFERKHARDLEARRSYRALRTGVDLTKELFMMDIMRENMESGDARIQRALS